MGCPITSKTEGTAASSQRPFFIITQTRKVELLQFTESVIKKSSTASSLKSSALGQFGRVTDARFICCRC